MWSKRITSCKLAVLLLLAHLLPACQKEDPLGPGNPDDPSFAVEIGSSRIPYICIDTDGFAPVQNEPKVPARMRIYQKKALIEDLTIGIEYRGSTSFRISDKKSYGIESWDKQGNDVDVQLFDYPPEEDFILSGHIVDTTDLWGFDRTLMYNFLGYTLYRQMGPYASRTKFVELEINGEYQGVYVFMEKLKRDRERIDVSRLEATDHSPDLISGGYILKIDKTTGGDHLAGMELDYFLHNWEDDARYTPVNSFRSAYDIYGRPMTFEAFREPYHDQQYLETYFQYEYPREDRITEAQKTYISQYIQRFETALLQDDFSLQDRTYTQYIDLGSFVDHFILNELVRNVDGYRLSTFLYKDRGGKLHMGPVWDLDIGYFTGDRIPWDDWVIHYNQYVDRDAWMLPFWWTRLMEDPLFTGKLKTRWNELRLTVLSDPNLLQLVSDLSDELQENGAIERNYRKWKQGSWFSYPDQIEQLKSYLQERAAWMDGAIQSL